MTDIVETLRDPRFIGQEGMRHQAADEIERLRRIKAEAERVCAYDWSDNDDDAVRDMEALRAALTHD